MTDDAAPTPDPTLPSEPAPAPPSPAAEGFAPPPPGYAPPPPTGYPAAPPTYGYAPAPYDPNAPVQATQPNDTLWAVLSHLSYFVLALIFPLIVMLTVGKDSPFVRRHSTEALNFHISLLIYSVISAILILVIIGIFLLIAVAIFGVVMAIIAAIKAGQGEDYRYPLTLRLVK
ncbi:MAG TPA: DUF4870 domain-containing protein [Candidatus Limnocylindria bacterium]|nr:DUF4870 domain-containing protein [Candidatus Limnocylindria bacterium]